MPISHLEYEQKAVECLRRARVMSDNTHRALLHQMALAWIERLDRLRIELKLAGLDLRGRAPD
jgi:hypothetical protein